MDGYDARCGIFDALIALEIAPGDEVFSVPFGPSVFKAGGERLAASAVDADAAAAVEGAAAGLDVDETGRA